MAQGPLKDSGRGSARGRPGWGRAPGSLSESAENHVPALLESGTVSQSFASSRASDLILLGLRDEFMAPRLL